MKKSVKDIILKGVLLSLIPALCTYLGQSNNVLTWLQEKGYLGDRINLERFADWMNLCSVVFTFALLTVPLIISEIAHQEYKKQRDSMIKNHKDIFEITLKKELELRHCKLNVRIFVPKITLLYTIKKKLGCEQKLEFHIRNVEGLAEKDITDNLKFEVTPNKQGLVGDCYNQKAVLYDDDLEHSNETNYNLTRHQIAKTNILRFILVCPIYSESEDHIDAIIALDSCDEIKINSNQEEILRRLVLNYTQSLYECIPELFKEKGGIL